MGDPTNWIPKDQLIEGHWYRGKCRNAAIAQWKEGRFHYMRYKFGHWFLEDIKCPEDDKRYDVFFAFENLEDPGEKYWLK